ncbi:hydroxyproline-rich glycoprotein family protein [Forsythia ovata]|uniref:Hydroxyproline-rich glycoprotein family protein n=1 Tax=Forsythia ovata TaxID=205694 RepID=A0ABD1SR55_9LAMI
MPIKSETKPPPRIGKIGPYTVFVTPPATPNPCPKPDSPKQPVPVPVQTRVQKAVQPPTPPVMAPPVQYSEEKSVFAFFWDAVTKVQNAHASLDEHVAHWFGLNQSKYQWALDDYCERNGKNQTDVKVQTGIQNV